MRVLVLTQVLVYPADAGPKIKTLEVLRYLAAHHEVTYCTFVRSEKEVRDAQKLREVCPRVITVPLGRSHASNARFVPADWSGKVILDEHNAVWQVVERLQKGARNPVMHWLLGREVRLIRKLEGNACRRAQVVIAVSEHDREALWEVAGKSVTIEVVPITVDAEQFRNAYNARDPQPNRLFT